MARAKKAPKSPKKRGNPSRLQTYTEELADEILQRIADGETLRQICRDDHMPDRSTVQLWIIHNRYPEFVERYRMAREAQMHSWADEIVEIADNSTNDWVQRELKSGRIKMEVDKDHVNRSRLRVDTRKWHLARAMPNQYGDKIQTEVTGKGGKDLIPDNSGTMEERMLNTAHSIAHLLAMADRNKSQQGALKQLEAPKEDEDEADI